MRARPARRVGGQAAEDAPRPQRPRVALFIDAENVSRAFARRLMRLAEEEGEPCVREAYGDFANPSVSGWVRPARELGIRPCEQPSGGRKKNSADCALTVGAMDARFTRPDIGTFVIATSDGDFSALVAYLTRAGIRVVVAGAATAPKCLRACATRFVELDFQGGEPESAPAPIWAAAGESGEPSEAAGGEDDSSEERPQRKTKAERKAEIRAGKAQAAERALRAAAEREGGWLTGTALKLAVERELDGKLGKAARRGLSFEKWVRATGIMDEEQGSDGNARFRLSRKGHVA